MKHTTSTLRLVPGTVRGIAAALFAAALLAACSNSNHTGGTAPGPVVAPSIATPFSMFTQDIFASPANSTPATVNGVNIDFDVNDQPTAFAALLM